MTTQRNPDTPSPARVRGNDRRPIAAYDSYREVVANEDVADQAQALLAKMSGAV